ncbi:DUF4386 family protein [Alteromonas sp. KUL49]|uniref:DUF4386 family protein n=1 Tax=Alteromonas sp. KUL49 TaxID=2480798 RepID=UPI00102F0C93|nr:DUF4386 family protein [Alteromonas sp. KUL49]TAP39381.1 DUF4386 family protein [Alteromonas sp. KUL49]GEA12176.1 hypothetical protein KUL49_25510 [Alteromonas sp. KUL49]
MERLDKVGVNSTAKAIGILLLVQMFAGIWLNFFFYKPLFADPLVLSKDTLNAMIGFGVLLAIALSAINFTICMAVRKWLHGRLKNHFIWALSLAGLALCLTIYESVQFSELGAWIVYANGQAAESLPIADEHIRQVLAIGRNKAHFMAILISSVSILAFYSLLLRAKFLPTPLMWFAVTACILQVIAVAHAQFDLTIPMLLQLPLAINQLVLPLYLLFKGFNQEQLFTGEQASE